MKKFILSSSGAFLFSTITIAQPNYLPIKTERLSERAVEKPLNGLRTTAAVVCTDTVEYTLENTLNGSASFQTLTQVGQGAGSYGEGLAQWFDARQPVTVSGFRFFARAKYTGTTSLVNVSLYSAKADSTPNVKLATANMTLNYVTGGLAAFVRDAIFTTPVTVTGPYLIAIEGPAASSDTFQLIINGDGDGFVEKLAKVRVAGAGGPAWRDVLTQAYGLDVDLLAYPFVRYSVEARYTTGGSLTPGGTVNFTNTSSPIFKDWFYNRAAYYNAPRLSFNWNLGEGGAAFGKAIDTSKVYASAGDYSVRLKDSLFGWTMECISDTVGVVRIGAALPVKLVNYEARKKDNKVSLTWTSDNELNSDYYVIERSADGINFTAVKKVHSSGTLQSRQSYTFEDAAPLDGINYYRLVQFDKDGRATYYGIRVVSFKDNIASLQVYPNPATDIFTIRTQPDSRNKGEIFISDATGRIVKRLALNASGVQTVQTGDLINGNYFIHLNMNGATSTRSILINKP